MKPRLLFAEQAPGSSRLEYRSPEIRRRLDFIKPEHWEHIVDDMVSVVHGWGTARRISTFPEGKYKIGGKTGTAQVFTVGQKKKYKDLVKTIPDFLKDHALFVAFAPHDKPKIAVAVIVENGEHGSSGAAPLAGEIIRAYMKKLEKQQQKIKTDL